jgi:hypothetical protein
MTSVEINKAEACPLGTSASCSWLDGTSAASGEASRLDVPA